MFTKFVFLCVVLEVLLGYAIVGKLPSNAISYDFEQTVDIKLPTFQEITKDERELSKELLESRPETPQNLPVQKDTSKDGKFFHSLEVMRVHYKHLEDGHWLEYFGDIAEHVHKLQSSGKRSDLLMAENELYLSEMCIASCHELCSQVSQALKHCKASKTRSSGFNIHNHPKCIVALTNIATLQSFHGDLVEKGYAVTTPILYKLAKKPSLFQKARKNLTHA